MNITMPQWVAIPAIFPTLGAPEIDYEGIRRTQELEDRLNRKEAEICARLNGIAGKDIYNPCKHILNPWKYK